MACRGLAAGDGRLGRAAPRWAAVTVGSETEFFDPPAHKDIDTHAVVDRRRMLSSAGYGVEVEEVEAKGQEDRPWPAACRAAGTSPPGV